MFRNLLTLVVVAGLGYWYYTGPYQDRTNPSREAQLQDNAKKMELCLRGEAYARGTTGEGSLDATERCAQRHGLVRIEGAWYRR